MTEIEQNVPLSPEVESAFREAYEIGRAVTRTGRVADYIPELAKADRHNFGVALLDGQGHSLSLGDADTRFSIQSVSKVIILALSLNVSVCTISPLASSAAGLVSIPAISKTLDAKIAPLRHSPTHWGAVKSPLAIMLLNPKVGPTSLPRPGVVR